ncbi:MAG: PIN domain-containing protein [Sulfuricella sp.]|jgi:tRNA(fMet)-specific endonuclease VapC
MRYLLDTNIVIYIIKRRPPEVAARFAELRADELCLSSISLSELLFGAAKSQQPAKAMEAISAIGEVLEIAAFDQAAARAYGPLRAELERQGRPIGALDTLIAAHALSLDATLVTHNIGEFSRVPGLRVEDWCAGVS